ncbi:FliM/FliN family flagellar motor switch protein [Pseudoxanthomonas sp. UTMC 1351]|uniref:FliM/FliN family flagellar motor switch protein n=1 Tax=Pseudoxanthomonas sp. UTMC 1351 TaxID=2695853 RepID=UPI0034CFEA4B
MTACPAWPLREVPPDRLAHEAAFRRCQALGWHVAWEPLPAQRTLIRFRQSSAHGMVVCLVPTAQWAALHWPQLPGLAWDALDEMSARKLFDAPPQGPLAVDWLDDGQTLWLQQVSPAPLEQPSLPCLHTVQGPIWVEQLEVRATVPMAPARVPSQVPVAVLYRLGHASLTVAQLQALRVGDVVLIGELQPQALLERRPLFSFSFDGDHMIISEFDISSATVGSGAPLDDAASALPTAALDVAALPMTVEVILCQLTHTVAELGQMQPGSTYALPSDAHRQVELRVHGQRVAKGELVRVGEGLGVQIEECAGPT